MYRNFIPRAGEAEARQREKAEIATRATAELEKQLEQLRRQKGRDMAQMIKDANRYGGQSLNAQFDPTS